MSTPTAASPDGPDALELVDVQDLWDLAVGDQIVVEFQRYHTPVKTQSDTLTGTVVELRSTYEKVNRALFQDDAGDIYRVVRGGKIDKLRDEGMNAAIGREADVKVIREIAPDGGREVSEDGLTLAFPDLEDKFGEQIVNTAAHVLDRDLLQTGEVKDELIAARIRGIDTPEELAAYRAVETRTRNRDRVHELLTERAEYLAEHGYRPDDLVAALHDQDADLPDRFRLRVPLWVATDDLREKPEIDRGTGREPTTRRSRQAPSPASSSTKTTQVSLVADGGVQE
ncbi:MAG: hypothetical protein ABEI99_06290 [Halobaculum sp.]